MSTAMIPYPPQPGSPRGGATARIIPLRRDRRQHSIAQPRDSELLAAALAHAADRGIAAVWTADHSATVELARVTGPHQHPLTPAEARYFGLTERLRHQLALPPVRCAVYEQVLGAGTPFDIYRWVNLLDLAAVWRVLCLPRGIRYEWQRALRAARLI